MEIAVANWSISGVVCALVLAFATASAAAPVATVKIYDRDSYKSDYLSKVDEITENFDSLAVGSTPGKIGGMTLSSFDGGNGLVVTDARNASSGKNSLASPLLSSSGKTLFNLAIPQKVRFSFAKAITSFAVDINTFLGSPGQSVGAFFAILIVVDPITKLETRLFTDIPIHSIYDPFDTNSKPGLPKVGHFIGFTSDTPFTSVVIGQRVVNPNPLLWSLDTVTYVPYVEPEPPAPVPGPLTLPLMLTALGLLGVLRRRSA